MPFIDEIHIYGDGGCKPNPGTMVCAYLVTDMNGNILKNVETVTLGQGTNVTAEFKAIECALDAGVSFTRGKVFVFSDNEFVIQALNKAKRIHKGHLKPLIQSVYSKSTLYKDVCYNHVSENNKFIKICDQSCQKHLGSIGIMN